MQDRFQRHRDEQQRHQQRRRRQQQLEQKETQQREKWQQQRRRFRKRADMKRNTSPVGSSESPEVWRSVVDRANNYNFRSAPGPQMSVTRDPAAHRLAHERRKRSIAFGNHHASAHARTSFN